jgi:acyl dehydratase
MVPNFPSRHSHGNAIYRVAVALLAAGIVAAAIVGAVRYYSPVPLGDMWNGYLDFFMEVQSGNHAAWWAQHNEHRIVLARLLFWLDLSFLDGRGISLIVANYLLVGTSASILCLGIRRVLPGTTDLPLVSATQALVIGGAFFWSQQENLTWGFQSQFFLAQLLPLAALYILAGAKATPAARIPGIMISCVLGIAACGTMANGVLTLPLMVGYALLIKMRHREVLILAIVTVATVLLYSQGYAPGAGHAPLLHTLQADPLGITGFVLTYLGNPIAYIPGFRGIRHIAPMLVGATMLLTTLFVAVKGWRSRAEHPLTYAMVAFIAYVVVTAAGTALGRLTGSLDQALISRYTTPPIMAWCALLVAALPRIATWRTGRRLALVMAPAILLALLPTQATALRRHSDLRFEKELGALALALHVRDEPTIAPIFPFTDWAMTIAAKASERHLSVFGFPPLIDARALIGSLAERRAIGPCAGSGITVEAVADGQIFSRIRGRIQRRSTDSITERIEVVGADGRVVGLALDGSPRIASPQASEGQDRFQVSDFAGYVLSSAVDAPMSLVTTDGCYFPLAAPLRVLSIVTQTPTRGPGLVTVAAVRADSFTGSDVDKSRFAGIRVLGSLIRADKDTASVNFHVQRGEHIFYRSGPTAGRQRMLVGTGPVTMELPVLREWTRLSFDDPRLPDAFDVTIRDDGDGWGEWSAIAVGDATPAP